MSKDNREKEQSAGLPLSIRLAQDIKGQVDTLLHGPFTEHARLMERLRNLSDTYLYTEETEALPPVIVRKSRSIGWEKLKGHSFAFVDGGLAVPDTLFGGPVLLQVGTYTVQPGERDLQKREDFRMYPVLHRAFEGGDPHAEGFPSLIRMIAECLGGLSALYRNEGLSGLFFHGPLVYPMASFAGSSPFSEGDIDSFLQEGDFKDAEGRSLKERYLTHMDQVCYPLMTEDSSSLVGHRVFEPVTWLAFLLNDFLRLAQRRGKSPLIAGAVERVQTSLFVEKVVFPRLFRWCKQHDSGGSLNQFLGRTDLSDPKRSVERLGYNDAIFTAMLLQEGEYTEFWELPYTEQFRPCDVQFPHLKHPVSLDFRVLASNRVIVDGVRVGFPSVRGSYLQVSSEREPIRVEVFSELDLLSSGTHLQEALALAIMFSKLLPGYGFPVGLDIADKFAHIPKWMSGGYQKALDLQMQLQEAGLSERTPVEQERSRLISLARRLQKRAWHARPKSQ